jgi:hypothetical protein
MEHPDDSASELLLVGVGPILRVEGWIEDRIH